MVFLKKRRVNGEDYYYAATSKRISGKTVQKDVYYFGKKEPTKHEWLAVLNAIELKDDYVPGYPAITEEQSKRIAQLNTRMKNDFKSMSASEKENFFSSFYNDYIYNTNSIEGSTLTREQTYFVTHENQGVEGKSLKEIHMATNLMSAVKYLESCKEDLSLTLIRKIHSIVQENIQPKEELGKFKLRQNYIVGTEFLPTPPGLVKRRMRSLMDWYARNKNRMNSFELVCIFHARFVSIHPFVDGNGRTARLLHNHILARNGISKIIFRASTKQKYYSALRAVQVHKGHAQFLDYCLDEFICTYESH